MANDTSAYMNVDGPPFSTATPSWLNKGDNAWQMTAATLVGMQSVPGLVILYGSYVKKKWAVNSAFMALYAFAAVLIVWVLCGYRMSFGDKLIPFWGKAGVSLTHDFFLVQSTIPESGIKFHECVGYTGGNPCNYTIGQVFENYPMATMVYFQFVFAAITVILIAGSLLGRMNFYAWIIFVPLWVIFSYSIGCFSLFGGGFLYQMGVIDYSGGYVIHLSSGIAGFTAAYWVGARTDKDRQNFPPNNLLMMLAGAGLLWLGWSGFNGGDPLTVNIDASLAVINTHICTATSLLVWASLDTIMNGKVSVIGAVQGMVTGLVAITPAAGVIEGWAAIVFGLLSGSIPWYTMNVVHNMRRFKWLRDIDDTMGVFHTHAVAGTLGGVLAGIFAEPTVSNLFLAVPNTHGLFYPWNGSFTRGIYQVGLQVLGAVFIIGWNLVVTSLICNAIKLVVRLRLSEEMLAIGDDAVHGEEAYALYGDGNKADIHSVEMLDKDAIGAETTATVDSQ
ncbi:unnamed protein product [Calypogeia fissa]